MSDFHDADTAMRAHDADTVSADTTLVAADAAAWSQCDELPEITEPLDTHRVGWRGVLKVVAAAAAVAVGAVAAVLVLRPHPAAPPAPAPPTSTSSAPTTQAAPPPSPETPDERFLGILRESHVIIVNPDILIRTGHKVCDHMAANGTDITAETTGIFHAPNANGTFTIGQVHNFVLASVTAYCPQYLERGLN